MNILDKDIRELQKRLNDGLIQRAYRGIVSYMSRLRTVFADQRGERATSGLYQGYFDMTYFALFPDELKERDLKPAVGIDAILMAVLATDYSLENKDSLTTQIVEGVMAFEQDIFPFLNEVDKKKNP